MWIHTHLTRPPQLSASVKEALCSPRVMRAAGCVVWLEAGGEGGGDPTRRFPISEQKDEGNLMCVCVRVCVCVYVCMLCMCTFICGVVHDFYCVFECLYAPYITYDTRHHRVCTLSGVACIDSTRCP